MATPVNSPVVDKICHELSQRANSTSDESLAMPAEFYTSADYLELEKERVFHNDWVCLGHEDEVKNPGDYLATELLDEPLLVARGKDKVVRVFSNVCRHRGNMIMHGSGNQSRFVCQYHAWTYGDKGELVGAPLMKDKPNFNKAACKLPEFKVEIWNKFVFVNLDGKAPPLAPRLEKLQGQIASRHHEERNLLHMEEDVWDTNWKCLVENFIEGYHLSSTHPTTLHPITPTRLCKYVEGNEQFSTYLSYYDPSWPPRGPFHPDLTEDETRHSVMGGIFPSFVFGFATDFTLFIAIRPKGVNQVSLRWGVCGPEIDPNSATAQGYVQRTRDFNAEDKEKLETLSQALKSKYYQPGPLAPSDFEGTIWDFLLYMARKTAAK